MSAPVTVTSFVAGVSRLDLPGCFNPYADRYAPFDLPDAPAIRRANLTHVLKAAAAGGGVDELWIGLELGHNGGRRTGLAMTDDTNLVAHGRRFGVADRLLLATQGGPAKEVTAGIVWQALQGVERPVFLWNIVPVHPHLPDRPLSNRRHNAVEREASLPHLDALVVLLSPKRVVAIGKGASAALAQRGYEHNAVRHPAYGGKSIFLQQIESLNEGVQPG